MVQSLLIFAFGFLAAALLAFMIAPAIWRRAVYLTRRRIDSSLPLSIGELNAEKDALRAEHAMALRRVELRFAKLRENDTLQKTAVADRDERIRSLEADLAESTVRGQSLDSRIADLENTLGERKTELSETSIDLESTRAELSVRTDEYQTLRSRFEDMSRKLEKAHSDIEYKDGQIDLLNETLSDLKSARKDNLRTIRELQGELTLTANTLATEREKLAAAENKLEQTFARNTDLEVKLERREKDLERLREQMRVTDAEFRDIESRAIEAEQERRQLEGEVHEMTVRINRLSATLGGQEPEPALEAMRDEAAARERTLGEIVAERDALKAETVSLASQIDGLRATIGDREPEEAVTDLMARAEDQSREIGSLSSEIQTLKNDLAEGKGRSAKVASIAGVEDPEEGIRTLRERADSQASEIAAICAERDALARELADRRASSAETGDDMLREKLNELAAEVVAMAARLEGPQSRINQILDAEDGPPVSDIVSLADRIKDLQRKAQAQRSA